MNEVTARAGSAHVRQPCTLQWPYVNKRSTTSRKRSVPPPRSLPRRAAVWPEEKSTRSRERGREEEVCGAWTTRTRETRGSRRGVREDRARGRFDEVARNRANLQLLLVLDEVHVLMVATLVARRHRVRMAERGRARVLEVAGGARWHREQQLRSGLLHALVHPVDAVDGGAAGAKIRQVEEGAEAHDAKRHEYHEDQVLLARTEGPSREQRHRYAVGEALVRRQHASRRAHLTASHRHPRATRPRHLITNPRRSLAVTRKTRAPVRVSHPWLVSRHTPLRIEHHLRATVDISPLAPERRSADVARAGNCAGQSLPEHSREHERHLRGIRLADGRRTRIILYQQRKGENQFLKIGCIQLIKSIIINFVICLRISIIYL